MSGNIVYSRISDEYIPVNIKSRCINASTYYPASVEYNIYDGRRDVGHVRLSDTDYGCYVMSIRNKKPHEYGKFALLADKLEVQYCLDKKMPNFEIRSYADLNSHALHYLRGIRFEGEATPQQIKRFRELFKWAKIKSFDYNTIVKYIIDHTPKGERFNTMFLKEIPMYMPQELIQKYIAELLKNPLIIK